MQGNPMATMTTEEPMVASPPPKPGTTSARALIQRHPVLTFYLVAFAISTVGILLIIGGPANLRGTSEQIDKLFLPVMLAWLAGPSVASIVLTGLVDGRAGYRDLLARFLCWRVGARWYAVALLMAPLVYAMLCLALSLISPQFVSSIVVTSDRAGLLVMALAYGLLGGGFLEELGWTGFVVPRLRQNHTLLSTALIVGVLWGPYHFSVIFWSTSPSPSGALGVSILLVQLFAWLPAYRILMLWVYERTQSLLLAMLMHASATAGMLVLQPLAMSGVTLLTWLLVFAATWWVIVGCLIAAHWVQDTIRTSSVSRHGVRSL